MSRRITRILEMIIYIILHPYELLKPMGRGLYAKPALKQAAKLNLREIKIEMLLRPPPDLAKVFCSVSIQSFIPKSSFIALAVRYIKPKNVFEFGTYRGITTLTIANNAQEATIYTLDITSEEVKKYVDEMIPSDYELARIDDAQIGEYFRDYGGNNRIIQLLADSYEFDFSEYENKMDFIYVDGSHKYKYAKKDTENAFKMLSDTGIIMWDDVLWSDVMQVLAEFKETYPIYYLDNKITAIYYQKDGAPQTI